MYYVAHIISTKISVMMAVRPESWYVSSSLFFIIWVGWLVGYFNVAFPFKIMMQFLCENLSTHYQTKNDPRSLLVETIEYGIIMNNIKTT